MTTGRINQVTIVRLFIWFVLSLKLNQKSETPHEKKPHSKKARGTGRGKDKKKKKKEKGSEKAVRPSPFLSPPPPLSSSSSLLPQSLSSFAFDSFFLAMDPPLTIFSQRRVLHNSASAKAYCGSLLEEIS
jgi:hypothetical protein